MPTAFLVQAGSGAMTLGVPTSPGVAANAARDTLVARYNDLDRVERVFDQNHRRDRRGDRRTDRRQHGRGRAARGIPRRPAAICTRERSLLIFDEVISGFRAAPGGAQQFFGVLPGPDLSRQDHRRRAAGRRVRRTSGCDGAGRAGGTGVSGGHAVGKSPGDDRRALVSGRAVGPKLVSPSREAWRAAGHRPRRRGARGGGAAAGQCLRFAGDAVLHERSRFATTSRRRRRTPPPTPRSSAACSRAASIRPRRSSKPGSFPARTPKGTSTRR